MTVLDVKDLGFGYTSGTPVLEGLTTQFEPGETVAITGPSGRGKSTLLYILGLMLRPTEGEVRVMGKVVNRLPDAARASLRAQHYGFVFQDAALDPTRTVLDNVVESALYRREPRSRAVARASELLERFGVSLRSDARPGQISGGQAQRIALCRALLGPPVIILADEPTGNLDRASADLVVGALKGEAARGACVLVVTHDPQVVEACGRELAL